MTNKNTNFIFRLMQVSGVLAVQLIGACALIFAFSACKKQAVNEEVVIPSVKVFTVGKVATGQERRMSGKVQAADKSPLSFGVAGKVVEVIVKEGQFVAEGQLLAKLDEEPIEISLKEARARLSSLRAKLVEAEALHKRTVKLFNEKAKSQKDLDAAIAELEKANGDVKVAEGVLRKSELDYERASLLAPFAGQVVDVIIDPFQEVLANEAAVILQSEKSLEVEVRVPETLIRDVDHGQVVQVTFPTAPDVTVSGYVASIGAEAEAGNAFAVTVRLPEDAENLRPGMTASVTFNFSKYLEGKTVYLIPLSAIAIEAALLKEKQTSESQDSSSNIAPVFVYDPDSKQVKLREIVVGELRGNDLEVFNGLLPGDQVVSAGVAFLRDGTKVEIWTQR